ncbi:hypothetical protein QAD02_014713 [Eretmocerus hayati]|uniref:Uncharacterized protein n=1 Tax=Eretmocerus hayati TaxID=131215 RepID=A0ACC2P7T4_9HYME|nr:hypothetical protein QAD02_014713 [Eretmocerus hayati]
MDLLTDTRIPTRAAPKPPKQVHQQQFVPRNNINDPWSCSNDLFNASLQAPPKKKPPPRPPPPKFPIRNVQSQEKPKKPVRPTVLLSNLFGRKSSKQYQQSTTPSSTTYSSTSCTTNYPTFQIPPPKLEEKSVCLIDLSPPGSPTFTTRSSSDGVSVDSFGSDGNSNPSVFTSSGSTSQTESAFEDDFDFFGSLSTSKKLNENDPWKVSCSQDPFGSLESNAFSKTQQWTLTQNEIKEVGESNFFVQRDNSPFDSQPATTAGSVPSKPFVMPTIIRPKSVAKKDSIKSNVNSVYSSPVKTSSYNTNNYSSAPRLIPKAELDITTSEKLDWDDDNGTDSQSPPMPSLPPPPPPPEYIAGLEDGLVENSERPYGVALYDFPASQPGDLDLKEGDIVYLTKVINDNWIEGRVGNCEGIFPFNFVDVKIPLPGLSTNVVTALYAFEAETSDDLSFKEGARINVLSRISDEWLYGECNGKKGQFPANFVDKIPSSFLMS